VDNAYWLWTFQGRLLQKNNKDRFCQLLWRPRPPTLLNIEETKVPFHLHHVQYLCCIFVCVCVCVWSQWWQINISDTSYESCTAAPDSNSGLRLTSPNTDVILCLPCLLICPFFCFTLNVHLPPADNQEGSEEILKDLWAEGSSEPDQGF